MANDRLTFEVLSNIPLGFTVSADDIAGLSGQNRVKGIHPILTDLFRGVVILCTIGGVNYPNQWLDTGHERLKYYLEGRMNSRTGKKTFNQNIKTNKSIIDSHTERYPILVFTRNQKGELFRFEGEFDYSRLVIEPSGDQYFELQRKTAGNWDPELMELGIMSEVEVSSEGRKIIKSHLVRERDPRIIKKAIERKKQLTGKIVCEICDFDFEKRYGERGRDFIEGHHKVPLSQLGDLGGETKVEDIVLVCSNCHRMIHRKKPWLTTEELKQILIKN